MTPDEAFDRDVPEHKRDDVMTMIAEAAHDPSSHRDCITILNQDRIDAINVRAHGIIELDGEEYTFIVEDGNWNGTTLEDWNGGKDFEPLPRVRHALQPQRDIVTKAIIDGKGPFLIQKWDAFLKRPEVEKIISDYSYDRMVQPGSKTERHYADKARQFGFEIASQEEANDTRKRLQEATEAI